MVFDDKRTVGVTVPNHVAEEIARNAEEYSGAPAGSTCHSILPLMENLPPLARLPSSEELEAARSLAGKSGFDIQTEVAPIQVVGSGADLNEATMNGLERMAKLADMDIDEVKNRVTITGGIEIGRLPGMVHISMLTPISRLEQIGIAHLVKEQYGL
jgi:hypothetical protein